MLFPFNCLGCGYENHADWSHIGRQVLCRACGRPAIVPAPMEPVEGESRLGLAVRFACPVCGRNFATRRALIGQKIRCSGCLAGVRVPAGNSFPVEYASRIVLNALSRSSRPVPPPAGPSTRASPPPVHSIPVANAWHVPLNGNSGRGRSAAPAPGATFRALEAEPESAPSPSEQLEAFGSVSRREHAAVVLPSRGETMEQVRQEVAKHEAAETTKNAEKATKAKKKKRKKAGFFDLKETLTVVGGLSVIVGVLSFLAWYFPEFRFPLAGLLVVIGSVLYLLGALSLGRLAANEGFLKSMAYRFFPGVSRCGSSYTRWRDT